MYQVVVLKGGGNYRFSCATEQEARWAAELMSNPGWTVQVCKLGIPFANYWEGEESL